MDVPQEMRKPVEVWQLALTIIGMLAMGFFSSINLAKDFGAKEENHEVRISTVEKSQDRMESKVDKTYEAVMSLKGDLNNKADRKK